MGKKYALVSPFESLQHWSWSIEITNACRVDVQNDDDYTHRTNNYTSSLMSLPWLMAHLCFQNRLFESCLQISKTSLWIILCTVVSLFQRYTQDDQLGLTRRSTNVQNLDVHQQWAQERVLCRHIFKSMYQFWSALPLYHKRHQFSFQVQSFANRQRPAVPSIGAPQAVLVLLRMIKRCKDPEEITATLEALHYLIGNLQNPSIYSKESINNPPFVHVSLSFWDQISNQDANFCMFCVSEDIETVHVFSNSCNLFKLCLAIKSTSCCHVLWWLICLVFIYSLLILLDETSTQTGIKSSSLSCTLQYASWRYDIRCMRWTENFWNLSSSSLTLLPTYESHRASYGHLL